jgi:hypothetical protein
MHVVQQLSNTVYVYFYLITQPILILPAVSPALPFKFLQFMGKLSLEPKHKEIHSVLRLKVTKEEPVDQSLSRTVVLPATRETVMPPSPPPWD